MEFELFEINDAPEAAREDMRKAEKTYGTNLQLFRGLAASPATLKAYLAISDTISDLGTLTPVEQQVVYISVSAANHCTYCVAAHSTVAAMVKMPEDVLNALRDERALPDDKLEALRRFALLAMEHKGFVPAADLNAFAAAGYGQAHVLDVLTILAQKLISNYYNHMAHTPLDDMFKAMEWQKTA